MPRFTVRTVVAALSAAVLCALAPVTAMGQSYPAKPITIVVPLAAGTGMDALVRLYAEKLSQALGKPVVVENKPGAATMLALQHAASQPADGYTLVVSTSSAMAINPVLYKKVNYDHIKDFVPIALYVKSPFVLVVGSHVPAKSVPELIKLAKDSPKPITFSSSGTGTALHLSGEYMKSKFGLNMTHVPYRSSPLSVQDIVAGHVDMSFAEAGVSLPLIREGKLRALAVSSSARIPTLPDIAPFAQSANAPDFEAVSWHVLYAPAATPKPIVEQLHAAMAKIMRDPDMKQKATNIGLLPLDPPSIEETQKYLASERAKWGDLVRALGLQGSI